MKEYLEENNHPVNQIAKKVLKNPDPSLLYCLQAAKEGVASVVQIVKKIHVGQESQSQAQPIAHALQAEKVGQKLGGQKGDKQAEEKSEEVLHGSLSPITGRLASWKRRPWPRGGSGLHTPGLAVGRLLDHLREIRYDEGEMGFSRLSAGGPGGRSRRSRKPERAMQLPPQTSQELLVPAKILVVEWRRRQGELAALKTPAG